MSSIASLCSLFAQAEAANVPWHQQTPFMVIVVLAVITLPFLIGQWLASNWRMSDDGWRIGLVLFSVVAGAVTCWYGWPPRLGIDLSGGVNLIYEVDPTKGGDAFLSVEDLVRNRLKKIEGLGASVSIVEGNKIEISFPEDSPVAVSKVEDAINELRFSEFSVSVTRMPPTTADGKHVLRYLAKQSEGLTKEHMDKLVGSIGKRINPGGQKEVTVRSAGGDQIEVIIPRVDTGEIEVIKKTISTAGALKFRIVAHPRSIRHRDIVEVARQSESKQVKSSGQVIAQWLPVDTASFGNLDRAEDYLTLRKNKKGEIEALVLEDQFKIGGVAGASQGFDPNSGKPCVQFRFTTAEGQKFGELTELNKPDETTGLHYGLAILLDDVLKSAPTINERITTNGQITGNFSKADVEFLVDILNAGSLPASLSKIPVAQQSLSAQLGNDTIKAGAYAMAISTGAILVFMIFYYRFAGFVADLAVLLNLLLVMALVMLFKVHLTLAGLAGLMLSVGMSVDANVLIYERMREEMERGAALRMAIRNGFSRAMSTIIDSNLTTLAVAIVLYIIGSDQLRGFAATLILGLMLNLFTAVFCARVVFDIAERRRWITDLKMLKLFGRPNFDFVKSAKPAIVLSCLFIAAGLVAAIVRGPGLYGIDFTGGTAVQVVFKEATDIAEVRKAVTESKDLPDASVSSVASGEQSEREKQFLINTSNPKLEMVKEKLHELFPGLKTHAMTYTVAAATATTPTTTAPVAPAEPSKESGDQKSAAPPAVESGDQPKDSEKKSEQEKSDGKQEDAGRTSSLRDAAGLVAMATPESILLAQAEKTDAKTDKSGDAKRTDPAAATPKEADTPKKAGDKPVAPTTDPTKATPMPAEATEPAAIVYRSSATLKFPDGISQGALEAILVAAAKQLEVDDAFEIVPTDDADFTQRSGRAIESWTVKSTLAPEQAETLLKSVQEKLTSEPVFPAANTIGGRVAGDTKQMAVVALFVSNLLIIIYVWVRFQNFVFGFTAVVALVHDVLVAVAALALSYWLAPYLHFLKVDQFKISLDVVAALLTIVGFSINDTIVIFDRIREVKGKSPDLTAATVNRALNETLSRTILTAGTVFIVTLILYAAGGEGIHAFAFTMLIGVIAGSYSSLYIAAPLALWMQRKPASATRQFSTGAVSTTGAR
jgi:SecD/SecF fusion protein